jgi:hypothetical protein
MRHDATPVAGQHGVESLPIVSVRDRSNSWKAKTVGMPAWGNKHPVLDRMLSRGKLFTRSIAVSC